MISETPRIYDGRLYTPPGGYSWCRVCGDFGWTDRGDDTRCRKHFNRNPCCIEGCSRTVHASHGLALDSTFCGAHWRALVPPGSPERKIYNRFWARSRRRVKLLGKEHAWPPAETRSYWRFWNRLVSRARARGRGDLDVREINRVMGW